MASRTNSSYNKNKEEYTFLELWKIFELAQKVKNPKKLYKAAAWQKIVEKKILPGRSCNSLASSYRKYSRIGKEKALTDILKKGKYSQYFSSAPGFLTNCSLEKTPSTQISGTTCKDLSPVKSNFISEEEEHQEEEVEEDIQEFLLAVDDLESVLSYKDSEVLSYNLATNLK